MDSGVLFVVSSLVRKLVEDCFLDGGQFNIKQIFVLTHNPYFHKEISHKYETSRDDIVKKSSFFFVKKSDENVSTVKINEMECVTNESGVENVSPVKNSYDALWCEYRDARLPATLLSVIQRIVEYYFLQLLLHRFHEASFVRPPQPSVCEAYRAAALPAWSDPYRQRSGASAPYQFER
jgi:wobble nucleotide-excising tRNase